MRKMEEKVNPSSNETGGIKVIEMNMESFTNTKSNGSSRTSRLLENNARPDRLPPRYH